MALRWNEGLTDPHLSIAGSGSSRIGVLAGPGTGKTAYGLMRRVVRLLEENVDGRRILLLSFTRVAAADLRDKIAALETPGADRVRAATLHSFCLRLLMEDSVLEVTGRTPRILLKHEVDLLLRDIGGDYGTIHDRRRRLEAFNAAWARSQEAQLADPPDPVDRDFGHAIQRWLLEHRAMLIGEVIPEAYRYLSSNPAADALSAFDHVIVDEYQDLNALEQALLDLLSDSASLCVAGDDDQSIYSVRYANPAGILGFVGREEVEDYAINVCGRCPANVVAMANALMGHAPHRDKPDLLPLDPDSSGDVAIVQWTDVDAEVAGITASIAQDVTSESFEPGDILVLTNWRKAGERIRDSLVNAGIPTRSFFTQEELAEEDARTSLALLRLVADANDAPAMRVLIGAEDGNGRSAAYQRLLSLARNDGATPLGFLDRLAAGEPLGLRIPAILSRYRAAVAEAGRLRQLGLPELVDELFPEDRPTTEGLRDVASIALGQAADANDLLRAVMEAITQDAVPQSPDFIRVMSLHKSKGLTSPAVYIVGAVHGVLPTVVADDAETTQAALTEGRRLFFVALTRATKKVVISFTRTMPLADATARRVRFSRSTIRRDAAGYTVRTLASPFIAELGETAPVPIGGLQWLKSIG